MISQIISLKLKKKSDTFNKVKDEKAVDLIHKLLEFNPNKRINAEEALQHPYFSDFFDKKDLIVKRTPIFMEVNENLKLESH